MDCTVDTNILGFASRLDMDAIEVLNQIQRKQHKVVFDSRNEIYDEYQRCVKRAQTKRYNGSEMVAIWLKHAKDNGRIIYGDLTPRQRACLREMCFDIDDDKFVAACKCSMDKKLIADESDYTYQIINHLRDEHAISVISMRECLSTQLLL